MAFLKNAQKETPDKIWGSEICHSRYSHLFENFFIALSALFWAFVRQVAVYLLRTVESSGLLYAVGGNFVISLKNNPSFSLALASRYIQVCLLLIVFFR
jgi:hypothetical protein